MCVARPSNKYVNDAFKYGKAREGEAWRGGLRVRGIRAWPGVLFPFLCNFLIATNI